MNASVIIVARNRKQPLREVLNALEGQREPGDQVIVVDDASDDGTDVLLGDSFPQVDLHRVSRHAGYCLSTRINQGLALARHEMIWRLDSDCVPFPDALGMAKEIFDSNWILAGGILYEDAEGQVRRPDHPFRESFLDLLGKVAPWEFWRWQQTGELFHPIMCFGGNVFFSKERALAAGGFDSDFDGGWGAEDAWFAEKMMWNLGVRLRFTPGIAATHLWHLREGDHRRTENEERNRQLWQGKSLALRSLPADRSSDPHASGVPRRERLYALLSITGSDMQNYGNQVVEQCLLGELPPPTVVTSVFKAPDDQAVHAIREAGCEVAICSGTTVCGDGTPLFEWAEALDPIPVVVVAGCLWYPLRFLPPIKNMGRIEVSARDPYSSRCVRSRGGPAPYVGCPSLLLRDYVRGETAGQRIGLGFHRQARPEQVELFSRLVNQLKRECVLFVQEDYEMELAEAVTRNAPAEVVQLSGLTSPESWARVFSSLTYCLSGRLHQVVPAAALGIRSSLLVPDVAATRDTRYTLLEDLGIPMVRFQDVDIAGLARAGGVCDQAKLDTLAHRLRSFLRRTIHGLATDQ